MPLSHRLLTPADQAEIWDLLHIALWDPPPAGPRPRAVLQAPGVRIYAENWGAQPGDVGVMALDGARHAGACWMRLVPGGQGLGHVDGATPQLGIALYPEWQHQGHGAPMMREALAAAREAGHAQVSLTVHPENPARHMYERCGFRTIAFRNTYHLMLATLG